MRGELPGRSARGHSAASPCGNLFYVSLVIVAWSARSIIRLCGIFWLCLRTILAVAQEYSSCRRRRWCREYSDQILDQRFREVLRGCRAWRLRLPTQPLMAELRPSSLARSGVASLRDVRSVASRHASGSSTHYPSDHSHHRDLPAMLA